MHINEMLGFSLKKRFCFARPLRCYCWQKLSSPLHRNESCGQDRILLSKGLLFVPLSQYCAHQKVGPGCPSQVVVTQSWTWTAYGRLEWMSGGQHPFHADLCMPADLAVPFCTCVQISHHYLQVSRKCQKILLEDIHTHSKGSLVSELCDRTRVVSKLLL